MTRLGMLPAAAAAACVAGAVAWADPLPGAVTPDVARGRYLVQIAGCNDCHTAGYALSAGQVAESQWLLGDALGWRGPWGTTYAANLRLAVRDMTAEQFMARARSPMRPPMPWFNLRDMADADLTAIYAYLRHAGPAGEPAPAYVPPEGTPAGPFVTFPAPPEAEEY